MTLFLPTNNEFLSIVSNLGADGTRPATNQGTSVTPQQNSFSAAFTDVGVLNSTYDCYEIEVYAHTVATATENRMLSLRIGADPAGGTSYSTIIDDLLMGSSSVITSSQVVCYRFPLFIKAGTSLGVKASVLSTTLTAVRVMIRLYCRPTRPDLLRVGRFVTTIGVGTPATPTGTAITPGTASEGTFVEIGTLSRSIFFIDYGMSVDDTTMTTAVLHTDIALGDGSNKRNVIQNDLMLTNANEFICRLLPAGRYCRGANGDKIYARSQSSAALDSNYSVAAYVVGG